MDNNNSKKFGIIFVILVFCIFELISFSFKGIKNVVTNDSKTFKILLSSENKDLEDFKNDLLKNISIALKQAENGEVISFEDFCKEMSEEYGL